MENRKLLRPNEMDVAPLIRRLGYQVQVDTRNPVTRFIETRFGGKVVGFSSASLRDIRKAVALF